MSSDISNGLIKSALYFYSQVGTSTNVHYLEVVLYWGVFAKNPLFYINFRYTVPSTKKVDFPLLHSLANISVMQLVISTRYIPK